MSRRPAFQFYPADWRKESGLRLCSIGARGLWIEMMVLMHEGEPYGHLTMKGRPIDAAMLARLIGESPGTVKKFIKELEANEVFSRSEGGIIFSRRMVRDEEARERRAEGGKEGGKHGIKGALHGAKGGRPKTLETPLDDKTEGGKKTPLGGEQKPPPSSSSSSSPSEEPNGSSPPIPHRDDDWVEFPEWLPAEPWNAWLEMRRQKRAWPTPDAVKLAIGKLSDFRTKGHDPGEVLNHSTLNNWTGIFEPKGNRNGTGNHPPRDNRDGYARALDRRLGVGADGRPAGEAG